MLSTKEEYARMFHAEENLWWYKILYSKVLTIISNKYRNNYNISILDAGCGTGGLMNTLIKEGYENIKGFDFSDDAVQFCKQRNLNVVKQDITQLSHLDENQVDVIIINDVLYQFDDAELIQILDGVNKLLKPEGLLISNNQALKYFRGTHDIAVGAKRRFNKNDFRQLFDKYSNLELLVCHYWSFLLSPLIFSVRLLQRFQLYFNLIDKNNIKSDVSVPSPFVNNLLYSIVNLENLFEKISPWGSSLFIVVKKK